MLLKLLSFAVALTLVKSNLIPDDYCKLKCSTDEHTVCKRKEVNCGPDNETCGPDFKVLQFNDKIRKMVVDVHNKYRSRVALGKEKQGNQPSASNMREMSYDKDLEYVAQCWANSCIFDHDECQRTKKFTIVGQNLAAQFSSKVNISTSALVENGINKWYDEVKLFDGKWVESEWLPQSDVVEIGHYTQMLWADTYKVGCAAIYFTDSAPPNWLIMGIKIAHKVHVVCNYGPSGNVQMFEHSTGQFKAEPMYKIGKPATKCPKGWRRGKSGLCSIKKTR